MQHQCTQCHLCKSRSSARPCSFCDSLSNPTKVDTQSQLLLSEWLMKTPSYLPLFPSTPPQLSASFKQNGVLFQPLYLQNTLSTYEIKEESIGPLDIEDRDLLPTLEDFELVYNDLTRNGTIWPPSMFSFDAESFLVNFYSAEPAFRLIQCATSAFYAFPPKPETVQLSYYKRAKKAIDRIATRKPTFQSVQAYYAIYGFAYDKGQPLVALEFLQKAMSAMIELRMDFDPDNSPWLLPLNLTSRQKEERRRTFWVIYRQAVYEKAVSFTEMRILIDITAMKTASNIIGHELESSAVELALKWDAMILNQIALIKYHYSIPPKEVSELLKSDYIQNQYATLRNLFATMPPELLLKSQSPLHITPDEGVVIVTQILNRKDSRIPIIYAHMVAAVSVLHRPLLFCTALKTCHPLLISLKLRRNILDALTRCLQSAYRILSLFMFLEFVNEGTLCADKIPENMRYLVSGDFFASALLESANVLWFVKCRMEPAWLTFIPLPLADIMPKVSELERFLSRLKYTALQERDGAMNPLAKTVEAMISDMNFVDGKEHAADKSKEIEGIEIGMKVIALDEDATVANAKQVEPKAFMGLLGLEVGSGIRWKGRSEESWRLFWKLNG